MAKYKAKVELDYEQMILIRRVWWTMLNLEHQMSLGFNRKQLQEVDEILFKSYEAMLCEKCSTRPVATPKGLCLPCTAIS